MAVDCQRAGPGVISFDTNILLYSLHAGSDQHLAAREFFHGLESSSEPVVISELVLTELYCLLRNPVVVAKPLSPPVAVDIIQRFRSHPSWRLLEETPPTHRIMDQVWARARQEAFPRRAIYDARLALFLRSWGVTHFATHNVKDFQHFGFAHVWDPLTSPRVP